jgi:hypothetical protein
MKHEIISNSDDIIDSRDVIARIEELESDRDAYTVTEDNPGDEETNWTAADGTVFEDYWSEAEEDEYKALKSLADEASGYAADWYHGEALIRDSYFEEYAEELANDIGAIDRNARWPLNHIDWEAAADELKMDYTAVDFDGVTYWTR